MSMFCQDIFYGLSTLDSCCRSSNGNQVVNRDPRGDSILSMLFLMWDGKLCNFVQNFGRTGCKRGGRQTWKTSVFFRQNRSGPVLDWVLPDWTTTPMFLGRL